ncbi:MAG TPA: phenylalanine--tRNA ligase subunit beta [Thermoanaerobaculia bacterium]|nr:phenylalanine--tRNA ligase subunit beta [Thermoanaerobaculia bacterium]
MKFSRDWLQEYIDLAGLSDEELGRCFTDIGHAVEAIERSGDDTIFDLEVTTNRVDAMSHRGMARELAAALGRPSPAAARHPLPASGEKDGVRGVKIRIDVPGMCHRYTALAIRGIAIRPSPPKIARRLEAVGLRPINNVVDVTNYVMLALGHPLHAFDLDKLAEATIIVRAGNRGETIKSLDGETRKIDPDTVVIADARRAVALGGIIGGFDTEITQVTRNVLLECAWFDPSTIRRTARRLGIKTDASYRFERLADPNDTVETVQLAARLIVEAAGGTPEAPIDVVAVEDKPETLRLRPAKLLEASAGVINDAWAVDLFRRLGFGADKTQDGLAVTVPTWRGDVREEADLIEEVLRFYGLNNIPASLPRMTMGDVRREKINILEDQVRDIIASSGFSETMNYSFIRREWNALFSGEEPVAITNALSENVATMRVSLLPGLLESVVFNRAYGTRDGALFEVGRTYHRRGDSLKEQRRAAMVMFGAADFFAVKGVIEQLVERLHVALRFKASDQEWLKKGKRAVARSGEQRVADLGALSPQVLRTFDIKGEVIAAEVDLEALLASQSEWKMVPVARFPGVPMILAVTHGHDLEYQRLIETIRSFDVPYLHEIGLRDRFVPEGGEVVKTTLGMWYQAFDRSLTQEEVSALQQNLASRLTTALPVKLVS